MPAWTAQALVVTGGVISAVGFVGTAKFYRRLLRARSRPQEPKAAAVEKLRALASASNHLIVEGVGVTLLLAGLVMSSSVTAWVVLSGLALTLAAGLSALTFRYLLKRVQTSG